MSDSVGVWRAAKNIPEKQIKKVDQLTAMIGRWDEELGGITFAEITFADSYVLLFLNERV